MKNFEQVKKPGICAHSYEGGALCFITACREGSAIMGAHWHPTILLSAVPMALSMPGWENDNHDEVGKYLAEGIHQVADAGADFFICPDNTAHLVLEKIIHQLPVPGLHIADVVCHEIVSKGWKNVGLLGTKWTMTGTVYQQALEKRNLNKLIPGEETRAKINAAIFDELCQGIIRETTVQLFVEAIDALKNEGAECVILGCTEIPIIINETNSPLPVLDSTRLLAKYAVRYALSETPVAAAGTWIDTNQIS